MHISKNRLKVEPLFLFRFLPLSLFHQLVHQSFIGIFTLILYLFHLDILESIRFFPLLLDDESSLLLTFVYIVENDFFLRGVPILYVGCQHRFVILL
jgi:hypothetical protein